MRISNKFPVPPLIINGEEDDWTDLTNNSPYSVYPYEHKSIMFDNMGVINGQKAYGQTTGFAKGTVSSPNVLYNGYGRPATMSCPGGSFDVLSLYMTPYNTDNLQVTLVGSYGDGQVATVTLELESYLGPPKKFESPELSAFRSIDKLTFTPITSSKFFAMDDLAIYINSPCNM